MGRWPTCTPHFPPSPCSLNLLKRQTYSIAKTHCHRRRTTDPLIPYRQDKYIPPKRPYSFEALLSDILGFAANTLVEDGRLGMWMPTANEEEVELVIPEHEALELVSVCVQPFNKCE